MSKPNQKTVDCPTCHKSVVWNELSEFRPFCSKRCKLIDFGDWAMERNNIPGAALYPVDNEEQDQ